MKRLAGRPFDQWRDRSLPVVRHYGNEGDETCGVFNVPLPCGRFARVIASCGEGWDHVSVSLPDRCLSWEEMVHIKRAFFRRDEWAIEYHPPERDNRSLHSYCLHLWRPQYQEIPMPDPMMVAPLVRAEGA